MSTFFSYFQTEIKSKVSLLCAKYSYAQNDSNLNVLNNQIKTRLIYKTFIDVTRSASKNRTQKFWLIRTKRSKFFDIKWSNMGKRPKGTKFQNRHRHIFTPIREFNWTTTRFRLNISTSGYKISTTDTSGQNRRTLIRFNVNADDVDARKKMALIKIFANVTHKRRPKFSQGRIQNVDLKIYKREVLRFFSWLVDDGRRWRFLFNEPRTTVDHFWALKNEKKSDSCTTKRCKSLTLIEWVGQKSSASDIQDENIIRTIIIFHRPPMSIG